LTFFILPSFSTSLVRENHMKICESTSSNCMLHITIVVPCNMTCHKHDNPW
jgi:hypothetical protein